MLFSVWRTRKTLVITCTVHADIRFSTVFIPAGNVDVSFPLTSNRRL